jgi:NitT/TauT family transport system ATP-binding protein
MSQLDVIVSGLSHQYRSDGQIVHALRGVDLSVERGDLFVIVGPSGCGKSTLLRILLGLETATSGIARLDAARADEGIAYIPQSANLLPWRTALQNASLGLEVRGKVDRGLRANLLGEFQDYGLKGFEWTKWGSLSGGMRQKVAIICAFSRQPKILICDEPFSAIDFVSRLELLNKFKKACRVMKLTAVMVTHNIEEAIFLGNKVAVFSHRPGYVKKIYPVDLGALGYDSVKCRASPEFQRLFRQIWDDLQGE